MRGIAAAIAAATMLAVASPATALVVTRSFTLTASQFGSFDNQPAPFGSLVANFTLTYDDTRSGFVGAPDSFTAVTDGRTNAGAFSAAPIAGYFPANGISLSPRIGVGGALNGGNVSLNGTNDFYIVFASDTLSGASVSFTTAAGTATFLSTDAVVRETTAATAVPEPGSWMILLLGAAIVGGVLRRRRPVVALA
jgi:hypothetical protein